MKRVVITGMGAVSAIGHNVSQNWSNLVAGVSNMQLIEHFDTSSYGTRFAAQVQGLDVDAFIDKKDQRKMDQFIQYTLIASDEAIKDANLEITDANATRAGTLIGSGIGGISSIEDCKQTLLERGPKRISPFAIPSMIVNMASGQVSMRYNLQGPNLAVATACTTGTHALILAAQQIQLGLADVMVTGGAEKASSPVAMSGFGNARALSTRNDEPNRASRPWDKNRDGFVLGDGVGVLVLEELEHAKARGATIYAELVGYGMSGDAYHITSPEPEGKGAEAAMRNALNNASINPEEVNYINAHGTSTPAGDVIEVQAVKRLFGDHAYELAVSSSKSMTGHLLGAAGAIEAIFSTLAVYHNIAPPTINHEEPEDGCDLNFVPNEAQEREINVALSNSFGFGGTNGSVIFRKLAE
ncbi:MAG: beta-ketoacyl-ACP synthase II [Pseudomonadota bacterium]|nr:beta-ketoacyl-ACP synthase II [Pseudomonadota bacterium]